MGRRITSVARGEVTVLLATVATAGTLLVALALKAGCLADGRPGHQPRICYNDLQTIWFTRHLGAHAFPYQGPVTTVYRSGHLRFVEVGPGQVEYPVLTGIFAWVTGLPADGPRGFLLVSALALTPFALISAVALHRVAGRRALLFALSPLLAAFAFLNWDLLPVAAVATAIWAWRRDRFALAGVLLALGTCAKIWPGFVLLPLCVELLFARRWRDLARLAGAAAATVLAVDLPFVVTDPRGWFAPYLMQAVRVNDRTTNSIWFRLADPHAFHTVAVWSTVALVLAWALVLLAGLARWQRSGRWPTIPVAAALVSTSMLVGRVDSPQYGLWLLPFVVVLLVPAPWVAFYVVADLWLWLQWAWWPGTPGSREDAAAVCWVALAALTVAFLRAGDAPSPIKGCSRSGPSPGRCWPHRGRWPAVHPARRRAGRRTSGPG